MPAYAKKILGLLRQAEVRATIDDRPGKLGGKKYTQQKMKEFPTC